MYYNFWGLDITMCFGKDCPLKNNCIRYVAKPEKYQSYFEESPYNDGKCTCYRDYREYDEKYEGYNSLLNWLQDYENILAMSDEEDKLYERFELWDSVEEIFDLNNENNLYWKERTIRQKANTEFRLGNEEKALKMIEDYLKIKPEWKYKSKIKGLEKENNYLHRVVDKFYETVEKFIDWICQKFGIGESKELVKVYKICKMQENVVLLT